MYIQILYSASKCSLCVYVHACLRVYKQICSGQAFSVLLFPNLYISSDMTKKNPFFSLLKGKMSYDLAAFEGENYTCYKSVINPVTSFSLSRNRNFHIRW
jgi:hypothetical protein